MKLDETFKILTRIEQEISNEKAALEELGESDFTNKWLKDLKMKYDQMLVNAQLTEQEVTKLEIKTRKPSEFVPQNLAASYVKQRIFFTREADLEKIARACGYTIVDGSRHKLVLHKGQKITAIPRHREIKRTTAEGIMKQMAKGA